MNVSAQCMQTDESSSSDQMIATVRTTLFHDVCDLVIQ